MPKKPLKNKRSKKKFSYLTVKDHAKLKSLSKTMEVPEERLIGMAVRFYCHIRSHEVERVEYNAFDSMKELEDIYSKEFWVSE